MIKTATLNALFFLFAFVTITPIPSIAVEIVRDSKGYPVRSDGGPYYFLSNDHGLQIVRTGNDACALSVVQVANLSQGLPLRISSQNIRHLIVTGDLVNIEFDGVTPSHWRVQDGYVKVAFNDESPKGTFMFKESNGYWHAILYCPPDSDSDDACKYLKLIADGDNNKRLALGDSIDSSSNYYVVLKNKGLEQECTCTCPERSVV